MELDDWTFQGALSDFEGLAVVEFYAPWCRTCRNVDPAYKKTVKKISEQYGADDVRFFKVNFKENRNLCLRQRVFALPAVHFYTKSLGRINRFTLKPTSVSKILGAELDRYLGESGHLAYLKSLGATSDEAVSPLRRFGSLVGLLQAVVNADSYLKCAVTDESTTLNTVLDGKDNKRIEELESLFQWIDANDDGVIDANELAAVARAVGSLAPEVTDIDETYGALLECATKMAEPLVTDPDEEGTELDVGMMPSGPPNTLDFPTFVLLMESREVAEFRTPTDELRAAFEALDANSDGEISRDEVIAAMQSVVTNLPEPNSGKDWVKEVSVAFDVLDRDKSGTLDYEEFVAVLSGAAYTFEADSEAESKAAAAS